VERFYFPRRRQEPLTDVSENVSECGPKKTAKSSKVREKADPSKPLETFGNVEG